MSAAVAPVATRCEVHDLPPRWWSSTICPHSHGLPRGRWPRENVPCKLDDILRFKSNSSPGGAYLPGYYPCPELLWVLYNIRTRTKNFCEFCTTFIPVPGTSLRSVRPCHNTQGTGTAFSHLPGTSVSSVRPRRNTRNFCKFFKTFIPVPGTSVSSLRHSYPYPELP